MAADSKERLQGVEKMLYEVRRRKKRGGARGGDALRGKEEKEWGRGGGGVRWFTK